jgi:hypothetical protein
MEISALDHNGFKLRGKKATVTIDSTRLAIGDFTLAGPGEYEVAGVDVIALPGGVFRLNLDDILIGFLARKLTDAEKTQVGTVNILLTPATTSLDTSLEPAYVLPFGPKEDLDKFLKEVGAEGIVPQPKLVTSADKLPETTTVVVLE